MYVCVCVYAPLFDILYVACVWPTDLRQSIVVVTVNRLRAAGVVVYNACSSCAPRVASARQTEWYRPSWCVAA